LPKGLAVSGGFVLSWVSRKLNEVLHPGAAGVAYPSKGTAFYETADIPLLDVMKLYERDPTCKSSVDLLSASTVGMGFYITVDDNYDKAAQAKAAVDKFCEDINLDTLLCDMAKPFIACGNDFWAKSTPDNLKDVLRLPNDAIERINLSKFPGFKIPYQVTSYQLKANYVEGSQSTLDPKAIIHWQFNPKASNGYGVGLLQVLLHTLCLDPNNKRPAYAAMKAKIERLMPKIFEKYAGPDVLAYLEKADEATITKFQNAIKNRPEEGAWLFYNKPCEVKPVTLDPRAQGFVYYIDHMINQFYLGCETPLPRLFSTPGFTEASAKAAVELQDMLIKPLQRYVKRLVEREIFSPAVLQAGFDPFKAKVRLNWGSPDQPEMLMGDLISAAEKGLIRPEEFRKNAAKVGWQLWENQPLKK
jgi:hypothetical protein